MRAYQLTSYNQPEAQEGRIYLGDRDSSDPKPRKQANGTRLQADRVEGLDFSSSDPPPRLCGIALCHGIALWPGPR